MRIAIVILVIVLLPGIAAAELLATATLASEFGSDLEAPYRVLPYFFFAVSPGAVLFDETWLEEWDIGSSQTASPLSDPDFIEVANRLTNGRVEDLLIGARLESIGAGHTKNEQQWFGLSTRDFKGSQIDSIALRLDHLLFEYPNVFGGTSVAYEFTVHVYGQGENVPVLPATWGRIKQLYDDASIEYRD